VSVGSKGKGGFQRTVQPADLFGSNLRLSKLGQISGDNRREMQDNPIVGLADHRRLAGQMLASENESTEPSHPICSPSRLRSATTAFASLTPRVASVSWWTEAIMKFPRLNILLDE
jgi:hypothetical protein